MTVLAIFAVYHRSNHVYSSTIRARLQHLHLHHLRPCNPPLRHHRPSRRHLSQGHTGKGAATKRTLTISMFVCCAFGYVYMFLTRLPDGSLVEPDTPFVHRDALPCRPHVRCVLFLFISKKTVGECNNIRHRTAGFLLKQAFPSIKTVCPKLEGTNADIQVRMNRKPLHIIFQNTGMQRTWVVYMRQSIFNLKLLYSRKMETFCPLAAFSLRCACVVTCD